MGGWEVLTDGKHVFLIGLVSDQAVDLHVPLLADPVAAGLGLVGVERWVGGWSGWSGLSELVGRVFLSSKFI